jgi:hypothetical protein
MKTIFACLLFSFCGVLSLNAQVDIRFGPEIGYVHTRFPESDTSFVPGQYSAYQVRPRWGGTAGITGRMCFLRHLSVSSGLLYQVAGEHRTSEYSNTKQGSDIHTTRDLHRTLHKVVIPLRAGLLLGNGKVRFSIEAGLRMGYYFWGLDNLAVNSNTSWEPSISRTNPFWGNLNTRFTRQWTARVGVEIMDRWTISVNYAKGRSQDIRLQRYPRSALYHPNRDIFLTIGWLPFSNKKPVPVILPD